MEQLVEVGRFLYGSSLVLGDFLEDGLGLLAFLWEGSAGFWLQRLGSWILDKRHGRPRLFFGLRFFLLEEKTAHIIITPDPQTTPTITTSHFPMLSPLLPHSPTASPQFACPRINLNAIPKYSIHPLIDMRFPLFLRVIEREIIILILRLYSTSMGKRISKKPTPKL